MQNALLRPVGYAILAAFLFGVSTPLAKALVGEIHPLVLAGLLYTGMGLALLAVCLVSRVRHRSGPGEAPLRRGDVPWLAMTVLAGGVIAPVLLMAGLSTTPASTASLLLNFEAAATILIAFLVFRESMSRRAWGAVAVIGVAAVTLSVDFSGEFMVSLGSLAVIGACVFWGLDNNTTRVISLRDPASIGSIKGLVAGGITLGLAAALHAPFPGDPAVLEALALGAVSYGFSTIFFILALRGLGTARTGAYFSAAPFIGAGASFLIFLTLPSLRFIAALPLMVIGAWLLLSEVHTHRHVHPRIVHEHRHRHDDLHHRHQHPEGTRDEEHSHVHEHPHEEHTHPHTPDIHHRH
ncbi:drug/metabolite transporter (DMT)-like permease [Methanolinea mesophila]|uniref:DMT family transporter n=1 Tax=Methanolinea mesophila TaxID=547055 RepID=UPI001AE8A508|nr:DMT family transporter [Methanolinea mesophila]MBP1928822.1 drug/metabolite transporter (DMT)-like permease [Methanolinea mesophila]